MMIQDIINVFGMLNSRYRRKFLISPVFPTTNPLVVFFWLLFHLVLVIALCSLAFLVSHFLARNICNTRSIHVRLDRRAFYVAMYYIQRTIVWFIEFHSTSFFFLRLVDFFAFPHLLVVVLVLEKRKYRYKQKWFTEFFPHFDSLCEIISARLRDTKKNHNNFIVDDYFGICVDSLVNFNRIYFFGLSSFFNTCLINFNNEFPSFFHRCIYYAEW